MKKVDLILAILIVGTFVALYIYSKKKEQAEEEQITKEMEYFNEYIKELEQKEDWYRQQFPRDTIYVTGHLEYE